MTRDAASSTLGDDGLGAPTISPRSAFDLPRRASRAESAAEAVEKRIIDHKLPAGTHLGTRRELGAMLDVAPSTVSEAIKLLEERGRIFTRTGPRGGVFVAEPGVRLRLARTMMQVSGSKGEVADALEVRDALESAVIVSAASVSHPNRALTPMRQTLTALRASTDTAEFYRRILDFHKEVAALAANQILGAIYGSLLELVRSHDPKLELLPGQKQSDLHAARIQVHQAIADAIAAGDVTAASAAAVAHAEHGRVVRSPD
jgi:GntR family transcriptional repressor for pyruvate dehydrogenase complex